MFATKPVGKTMRPGKIYHQNHRLLGNNFFSKLMNFLVQKSEKIRGNNIKTAGSVLSKKFDYCLNLVYKHILFELGWDMGFFKPLGA